MPSPGQIAADAYRKHLGGVSAVTGHAIPKHAQMPPGQASAWEAAAVAVQRASARRFLREMKGRFTEAIEGDGTDW